MSGPPEIIRGHACREWVDVITLTSVLAEGDEELAAAAALRVGGVAGAFANLGSEVAGTLREGVNS